MSQGPRLPVRPSTCRVVAVAAAALLGASASLHGDVRTGSSTTREVAPFALVSDENDVVPCGDPQVDPAVDAGLFVWRECGGPWTVMMTGERGAGSVSVDGRIGSQSGLSSLVPRSLEMSSNIFLDSRDILADAFRLDTPVWSTFRMTTGHPWRDHFEFEGRPGAALCIEVDVRDHYDQLYLGPDRVLMPFEARGVRVFSRHPLTPGDCRELLVPDCPEPTFDPAGAQALLVWIDCDDKVHIVGTDGADPVRYTGYLHSTTRLQRSRLSPSKRFAPANLELRSNPAFVRLDVLEELTDNDYYFELNTGDGDADELVYRPFLDAGDMCVSIISRDENTRLLAGLDATPVTSPFDPLTLQPCEPPPGYGECGEVEVDSESDSGLFIWKSCDGTWTVAMTGVRDDGGVVKAAGSITSSKGSFDSIVPRATIESSDSVTTSTSVPSMDFDLGTINPWLDDFDVSATGASLCVTLDRVSPGLDVFAGPDRTPVGTSFDPQTYGPCRQD